MAETVFGLVLTGGGARGAYQAGVLKGISQSLGARPFPFKVLCGTSAGAINSVLLASGGNDYSKACDFLCNIWKRLDFSDVVETKSYALSRLALKWLGGLAFGGAGLKSAPDYLFDTGPLKNLLEKTVDFQKISEFERQGGVLAINTTNYKSGAAVTFYSKGSRRVDWMRSDRLSRAEKITLDHVMASSAIPIFFPPVKIGNSFFGDGAVRMKAPFSPAIHLGADKILAISVQKSRSLKTLSEITDQPMGEIELSDIAGVLLNAVFLDSLDGDLERLERINRGLSFVDSFEDLKSIATLVIRPSVDLSAMAEASVRYFPAGVRYLLGGIGSKGFHGSDLSSYLAFHHTYTQELVELGTRDAMARKDEILDFFGIEPDIAERNY